MRRVILSVTGLVAGTTLLISLKSAPGANRTPQQIEEDAARVAALEAAAAASASPTPVPSGPGQTPKPPGQTPTPGRTAGPGSPTKPPTNPAPTTTTKKPTQPGTGPITGDSVFTEFGYVQVAIKVSKGKITDVIAIELPADEPRSITLSERAGPILRERALAAQSADIDSVSGATWTSEAYRTSLQSALDKAGLG